MKQMLFFIPLGLVLALPVNAWACSVCFSGTDENRLAFILTTAFMSFMPFFLVGGVVYWIVRQNRAASNHTPGPHS